MIAVLTVLAFTSAVKIGITIGLVLLILWIIQRKVIPMFGSNRKRGPAKDALDNVDESLASAKNYLNEAEVSVKEDEEAAQEILKQSEDLKQKVEEKKKLIP